MSSSRAGAFDDWEDAYEYSRSSNSAPRAAAGAAGGAGGATAERQLWSDANAAQQPRTQYLFGGPTPGYASSYAAAQGSTAPAATYLTGGGSGAAPKMTILKRPQGGAHGTRTPGASSNNSLSAGSSSSSLAADVDQQRGGKSLAQRERDYAEARRRIMGDDGASDLARPQQPVSQPPQSQQAHQQGQQQQQRTKAQQKRRGPRSANATPDHSRSASPGGPG